MMVAQEQEIPLSDLAARIGSLSVLLEHDAAYRTEIADAAKAQDQAKLRTALARVGLQDAVAAAPAAPARGVVQPQGIAGKHCANIPVVGKVCVTITITVE